MCDECRAMEDEIDRLRAERDDLRTRLFQAHELDDLDTRRAALEGQVTALSWVIRCLLVRSESDRLPAPDGWPFYY